MNARAALGLGLLLACATPPPPAEPTRALPLPEAREPRHELLTAYGRQIYAQLRAGTPEQLLLDDLALRRVVEDPLATQYAALRARGVSAPAPAILREAFSDKPYLGACFDRARPRVAAGQLGLREAGFVFDRVLVVGTDPAGDRQAGYIGAWVEGTFVGTDAGVYALTLARVEEPRTYHADLALGPCDLEVGLH